MNYKINFANYQSNFSLPRLIVDENLKEIDSDYLKIILMVFKNPDKDYSVNLLSNLLDLPEEKVTNAIRYWISKNVLLSTEDANLSINIISERKAPPQSKVVNDSELKFLLNSMETMLGRTVTSTDFKTITYLYEYYRLPADVILMAIQYCAELGKTSLKYIESVCIGWYDKGIVNHTLAEEFLKLSTQKKTNESKIKAMFGLGQRTLIQSEEKFINTWFTEFQYDLDIIQLAFEKTIKNTGKVAFAYTNKILLNWHKKGYRTLKDILEKESGGTGKTTPGAGNNSYDIDLLDKYWDKVPTLD